MEFPADEVPEGIIRDHVFGRIESFEPWDADSFKAVISYANEIAASELTQFLNVVFGNSSIKPGIRVEHLDLPESLLRGFKGPALAGRGMRSLCRYPGAAAAFHGDQTHGAVVMELADLAYQFALGGMDIIKDDHGLSDQAARLLRNGWSSVPRRWKKEPGNGPAQHLCGEHHRSASRGDEEGKDCERRGRRRPDDGAGADWLRPDAGTG